MTITVLVLAALAVALLVRLWTLFGTRHEDEPQRPSPFMPPPAPLQDEPFTPKPQFLAPGSLAEGLAQVKAADPDFDEKKFLQQASDIFTRIVETYAGGRLDAVEGLLSPLLFAHFKASANARQAAGQTAESRVIRIRDADCLRARVEGGRTFITVQFRSLQENILRDAAGRVVGGAPGRNDEITDCWTFARIPSETAWQAVETGA